MKNSFLLALAALMLSNAACNCGKQQHNTLHPDYLPDPMALSFDACPVKDEMGNPVKDVFPDVKTLTINNRGVVAGGLKLTLSGTDAAAFSTDAMMATGVQASSSIQVKVAFAPVKKGDSKADLEISDEVSGDTPVHVTLVGTGSSLASQATLKVSPFNKDTMVFDDTACFVGGICQQIYPDTLFKDTSTLQIKVTNQGCPALKVSGIEVLPYPGDTGDQPFSLVSPTAPTAAAPILVATTGGQPDLTMTINFSPVDDGSGDPQRRAILRLHTNDPSVADSDGTTGNYDILLLGAAIKPDVYVVPSACQFSDPNDTCGYPTRMANQAKFVVTNGGTAPITIDGVTFKSNGSSTTNGNGRFSVASNIVGTNLNPGQTADLLVTHNDMPLYVSDLLTVSAKVNGGAAGSAGKAIISLGGGLKPCLSTDPAIDPMSGQAILNWDNPTSDVSAKPLMIKNGAGCGTLVINSVSIDTNQFFSLIDPKVAPGTTVPAGGSVEADVQYSKPVSGGTQVGTLRIDSNDSDYAGPAFYVVQLYSSSPLDQVPVAVLEGCLPSDPSCANGQQNNMSVSLSALGSTKTLTMSGALSYDPGNTSATPISAYQVRLVTKPSNATAGALANDGVKASSATQTLTLDPAATGLYRVTLTVYDSPNMQASGTAADLKINVTQ